MLIVHWTGKAVNKNKRYRFAYNTEDGKTILVKTTEYKDWLDSLGWTIKAQIQKRYEAFQWIMINATLARTADHHNLVDVVMDALQRCGLIRNDRDAGVVMSMPCEYHKRGEQDEIRLFIQTGEEEDYHAGESRKTRRQVSRGGAQRKAGTQQ